MVRRRRSYSRLCHSISGEIGQGDGLERSFGESKNIELSEPGVPPAESWALYAFPAWRTGKMAKVLFYELTRSVITRKKNSSPRYFREYDYRRSSLQRHAKEIQQRCYVRSTYVCRNQRGTYSGGIRAIILLDAETRLGRSSTRGSANACLGLDDAVADRVINDDHIFISHSLGSRITTDGLQRIAGILPRQEQFLLERGAANVKMGISPKVIEAFGPNAYPFS